MKATKILLTGILVSLFVGFAFFQVERRFMVRSEGEKILEGLLLCAGSLNDGASPHSGLRTLVGPLAGESCVEAALLSLGGEEVWKSGGWNDSDRMYLASFLVPDGSGMSLVTEPGASGSDSDYVFSLFPFVQNGERIGFFVLKQRVSDVRGSLWSLLGRTSGVATAAGLLVAACSLLVVRSPRKEKGRREGKLPPYQVSSPEVQEGRRFSPRVFTD